MKKDYEKPTLEIISYDVEISANDSGFEAELDLGEWWA